MRSLVDMTAFGMGCGPLRHLSPRDRAEIDPGGTELTLTHSRLPDADRSGTETGWNAALDNLERLFKREN
jgi:hypothetical protein